MVVVVVVIALVISVVAVVMVVVIVTMVVVKEVDHLKLHFIRYFFKSEKSKQLIVKIK